MNFFDYIQKQAGEERQAFLLHAPAMAGKTSFILQACAKNNKIHYVDILNLYNEEIGLDLQSFQNWVLQYDKSLPETTVAILFDQGDFLYNSWSKESKLDFIYWLKIALRSPAVSRRPYCFVLQTDSVITQSELKDSFGATRILPLQTFDAILG
jgi:hypothetical protein